jgi:hypothetical protein
MKTRMVIGSLLATLVAFQVMAQRTENDDMYFNSKDREKLKAETPVASASVNDKIDNDYKAFKKKHFEEDGETEEAATQHVNPTDSYSARTINPEYISRSSSEQASEDEQNYYVEGYTPTPAYDSYSSGNYNDYNNGNNNFNNNNNYGYGYGYSGSAYNSWYSPYYGYCNPAMSPYYSGGPGWTMTLGYMWGSPGWNSGWNYGASYAWGSPYYNPYSYYQPYGYGYPTYYYGGGSEAPRANYGKRPSRHSAVVTQRPRSETRVTSNSNGSRTSGRTRQTADVYYVKPYKRPVTFDNSSKTTRDMFTGTTDFPGTPTRTRSSSTTTESRPAYTPPTRSSSSGGSTPTRSSGGSSSPKPRGRD